MSSPEVIRKLKHDFKRPLSNLQMLVTILKSGDMEKAKLIGALEKIISEGNRALSLLEQVEADEQK